MKHRIKINIALIIVLGLLACSKVPTAVSIGTIEGTVSDFTLSLPIGNANITTNPPTSAVTSDSLTGMYTIEHVEPGIYKVQATKAGFDTAKVSISVVAAEISIADIALRQK